MFDTTPDLVVGAPHRADLTLEPPETQAGLVYVIDGAALVSAANAMKAGFGVLGGDVVEFDMDTSLQGNTLTLTPVLAADNHPAARFGWSITGVGDLDGAGDGNSRVDIAVGAPEAFYDCDFFVAQPPNPAQGAWVEEPQGVGTGFVEVIGFDSDDAVELHASIRGEQVLDRFGWSVSGLGAAPGQSGGEATGDSTPDLLVGAIGYDIPLGQNERLDDVGRAYLLSGATILDAGGAPINLPDAATVAYFLDGTIEGELLGESVAGGGFCTVTSPCAMFAIGSRLYTDQTPPGCVDTGPGSCVWMGGGWVGRTQTVLFSGSSYDLVGDYTGEQLRNRLGYGTALAWLPDMDMDGDSELLVGAPAWQPEVGRPPCNEEDKCQRPGRAYVLMQLEEDE